MAWENLRNEIAELFSNVVANEPQAGLRIVKERGPDHWKKLRDKQYYWRNVEKKRQYAREYRRVRAKLYPEDPEQHKERLRAYRAANKEKVTAYKKAYRKAHLAELVAYQKAYWAANKDRLNERRRARAKGIDV